MKKIEDYIHYYIGCNVLNTSMDLLHKLTDFNERTVEHFKNGKFRLALRPLADMTEEEAFEFSQIIGNASHLSKESQISQVRTLLSDLWYRQTNITASQWVKCFVYLISKGFDLFGLIESNLAIDSTTLNK